MLERRRGRGVNGGGNIVRRNWMEFENGGLVIVLWILPFFFFCGHGVFIVPLSLSSLGVSLSFLSLSLSNPCVSLSCQEE